MISGKTRLSGLIGGNVTESLSPLIHNEIAKELGNDMVYLAFNVCADAADGDYKNLEAAVKGAYALGFAGINVTAPYKVAAMEFADCVEDSAKEIGAINLLKYDDSGFVGYNTDVYGVLGALEYYGVRLEGLSEVVVLGTGGAAKAAGYALSRAGSCVLLRGRDDNIERLKIGGDLFVQATSAAPEELMRIAPPESLKGFKAVFDMNYAKDNLWLDEVKRLGIKAFDGKVMLVKQAIKAYEIIWGQSVPVNLIDRLLKERG